MPSRFYFYTVPYWLKHTPKIRQIQIQYNIFTEKPETTFFQPLNSHPNDQPIGHEKIVPFPSFLFKLLLGKNSKVVKSERMSQK